jgi:pSer/pThr/pTyr-binding forkhead associated (FHA) protein
VSRSHARIDPRPDGVLRVEDLGSRNGTWVRGRRIRRSRALRPGEPFRAGRTVLALSVQDGGGPPGPANGSRWLRRRRSGRVRLLLLAAALAATLAAALAAGLS